MGFQRDINTGIKRLRNQKGLTQDKFAELIGLTVEAVRNLEQNKYAPTAKTIDSICGKCNTSPIDLLVCTPTSEQVELLEVIMEKLRDCSAKELESILSAIDILRQAYRNK